jgi:uncharacterized phage protein (TIGR02220 family)
MRRGYTLDWRKGIDSDVWKMPPLYDRVWKWLRLSANHKAVDVITPKGSIHLEPGQRITSMRQIAEGVSWEEWGTPRIPSPKTISVILAWLQQQEMVTVESNSKGTVISIINWHIYQIPPQEKVTVESNAKETAKKQHLPTNNNGREIKPICADIINDLNTKGDFNYRLGDSTVKLINGRLAEGHTLDDFYHVHTVMVEKWRDNPKMCQYLRPKTLYAPSNFQGYLNTTQQLLFNPMAGVK